MLSGWGHEWLNQLSFWSKCTNKWQCWARAFLFIALDEMMWKHAFFQSKWNRNALSFSEAEHLTTRARSFFLQWLENFLCLSITLNIVRKKAFQVSIFTLTRAASPVMLSATEMSEDFLHGNSYSTYSRIKKEIQTSELIFSYLSCFLAKFTMIDPPQWVRQTNLRFHSLSGGWKS